VLAFGTRYLKKVFVFIKGIFTYAVVFFDTSVDELVKLGVVSEILLKDFI